MKFIQPYRSHASIKGSNERAPEPRRQGTRVSLSPGWPPGDSRKRRSTMPSNDLHAAFREGAAAEAEQLRLIAETPALLEEPDDSWEGWLPLHNASRWGASQAAVSAALEAFPDAVKSASKGGYEPLHLASMGGHLEAVRAIIAVYPEGALKADNHGRTPLDEAREGSSPSHAQIVDALLALPGVAEADAAEAVLRAARAEALMRPDDDESDLTGDYSKSVMGAVVAAASRVAAAKPEDATDAAADEDGGAAEAPAEEEESYGFGPRALASRMFRAATNALWRTEEVSEDASGGQTKEQLAAFFTERAKFIPLRLELRERRYLRLLEGTLHVSEYTDKVDSATMSANQGKRKQAIMRELHSVLSGLLLACDYEAGQHALSERCYTDYPDFFAPLFEVTRRYKVMNPEKMRETYGKMVYMLQDANSEDVQEELGFSLVEPIKTVHSKLKECNALEMLSDPALATATQVVTPDPGKSRAQIQREIKQKEAAIEHLSRKYRSRALPEEELKQCLYSIGDNNAYLYQARDPVDKMIAYLKEGFPATNPSPSNDLGIVGGEAGARLTHAHERQHAFVLQSLTLWREIANDMFRLWYLADDDLLRTGNEYEQRDTGQGLQRVQAAPRTSRAMHQLLHSTQQRSGSWVGSSLIHLGDSNVPNSLMFIDKYSQVEHILNPILTTLAQLESLHEDRAIAKWVDATWGGVAQLRTAILQDFFRYAFDGSGADNFFDAGSCIDGRLTSAWNWCSQLPQKPFFAVFKLAGITSFDGQFQA